MCDAVEVAARAVGVRAISRTRRLSALGERLAGARWPLAAAAAIGAASCVLLLVQFPALIVALYRNADNAATLLLAQGRQAGSITRIGDHPFYEAWWFMRATAGLPGHLWLWKVAPFAIAFFGIAAIAACAALVAGRRGFAVAAVGLVAMSPPLRAVMLVPEARVGLLLHAAALCAALLTVDRLARAGRMTPVRWAAAAGAVVAFTALGASDELLLPGALIPYAAASLVVWWCERSKHSRTIVTFALGTAAASVGLALLITRAMTTAGVVVNRFPVQLVALGDLRRSIGITLHLFAILAGGLHTAAGVVALLALALVGVALVRGALRLRPGALQDGDRTRLLYLTFWAFALLLTLGVVALTSVSTSHGVYGAAQRYLLGAWIAVVALLAGAATNRLRANVLLAAVAAFGVLTIALNLSSLRQPWEYGPPPSTAAAIERFVLGRGASVGYGGYWDVMTIGLDSNGRLHVAPIVAFGPDDRWAGHFVAANTAWFHSRSRRSFLVVDPRLSVPYAPHSPPAVFGHPIASRRLGSLTIYVYAHDLARDLDGLTS